MSNQGRLPWPSWGSAAPRPGTPVLPQPACFYSSLLASVLTWLSPSGFPGQPDAGVDLFLCLSMYAFCPKFPLPSCPPTVNVPSPHCMEPNAKTRTFYSLGQGGIAVRGGGDLTPEPAGTMGVVRRRAGARPSRFSVGSDFVQGDIGHCLETFLVVTTECSWHVVGRGQGFC